MRNHFPHHSRDEEEMIIVHPYSISSLILTHNDIGKSFVDCDVMFPAFVLPRLELWIVRDLVMKCRPKDLLAISIVVTLHIGIRDEDWD
jgi:hypothetical protein